MRDTRRGQCFQVGGPGGERTGAKPLMETLGEVVKFPTGQVWRSRKLPEPPGPLMALVVPHFTYGKVVSDRIYA